MNKPPTQDEIREVMSSGNTSGDDFYKTFSLGKDCTLDQIKKKFKELARIHHPDKNNGKSDDEMMAKINNAYRVLSNPRLRYIYDNYLYDDIKYGTVNKNKKTNNYNNNDNFSGFDWAREFSSNSGDEDDIYGKFSEKVINITQSLLVNLVHNVISLPFKNLSIFAKQSSENTGIIGPVFKNWKHLWIGTFQSSSLDFNHTMITRLMNRLMQYLELKYPILNISNESLKYSKSNKLNYAKRMMIYGAKNAGEFLLSHALYYPFYLTLNLAVISRNRCNSLSGIWSLDGLFFSNIYHGFFIYLVNVGLTKLVTKLVDSLHQYSLSKHIKNSTSSFWKYTYNLFSHNVVKSLLTSVLLSPISSIEIKYQSTLVSNENESLCINRNFYDGISITSGSIVNFTKNFFSFSSVRQIFAGLVPNTIYTLFGI